jgi:dihydrofolate reductase
MRKLKLYIAASLNGKIARADGSVDWLEKLPNPDGSDYGYRSFYDSIDATIQGHTTYAQVLSFGIPFPYADKENYVITRSKTRQDTEHVHFISEDPVEWVRDFKTREGKDIWLIGGGQVNTLMLNAGLIDELWIFIMPVILEEGIGLFEHLPGERSLSLLESKSYASGAVELRYALT